MKPILGSMKHADIAPTFSANFDTDSLVSTIESAVKNFHAIVEAWSRTSAEVRNQHYGYMHKSQVKLGRSKKTGKMVFSESRNQQRTAHQTIEGSFTKPQIITAFLGVESAILSIPALAHAGNRMAYRNFQDNRGMYFINDVSLNPYAEPESFLSRMMIAIKRLEGITVAPDAPLWMVGSKILPADSAETAYHTYWVLDAIGERLEKIDAKMKKPPNVLVGKLANMEEVKATCASLMKS